MLILGAVVDLEDPRQRPGLACSATCPPFALGPSDTKASYDPSSGYLGMPVPGSDETSEQRVLLQRLE